MRTLVLSLVLLALSSVQCDELDWWEKTIFYQIYPRSFKDSDGDGIGDLNGITTELQHLKDLGIGATWLSPMYKSPMYDFGYDIADFYTIHEEYGTMEDFENLLAKAKELDMKIILDFVPNHTSNESEWFEAALRGDEKYFDYFIWEDGKVDENGVLHPPNNWISVFRKSAWEYREEVGKFYLHKFVIGQPDLNYRNPDVVDEMKNVLRFWLDKGVAGFRVDAISQLFEVDKANFGGVFPDEPLSGRKDLGPDDYDYLDHIYTEDLDGTYDMVYQWRELLDEYKAKDGVTRVMMTEAYADIHKIMHYAVSDSGRLGAHMPFNFALIGNVNGNSTAADIKYQIDLWMTYKPLDATPNWVLGNHDNSRVATRYGSDLVDGMNMILLLLPGAAVTYMGEEIGMVDGFVSWKDTVDPSGCNTDDPINYISASRDPERTPFQWTADKNAGFSVADKTWLPVAEGYESLNVEYQKAAQRSHYKVYQALSDLRSENAFQYGRYESVAFNKDVLVFRRWHDEDIYIVVINMRDKEYELDLTYLENVGGDLQVVVPSIQSPKNAGDVVPANAVPVTSKDAFVVKKL